MKPNTSALLTLIAASMFGALACNDRAEVFDQEPVASSPVLALKNEIVIVDSSANRGVILAPHAGQDLERISLPIGHGVVGTATAADGKRAFILSAGDVPRTKEKNEKPALTIIENNAARRIEIESPHTGIAIDPLGRYVAVFASGQARAQSTFLENPNEIVLVDLEAPGAPKVTYRTLRSFGGSPARVTFSPVLALPTAPRRLLVVETEQDVTLLDLDHAGDSVQIPEITVRLTSGSSTTPLVPAEVIFDDGDAASTVDARIAVRLKNDSNVVTLTLGPSEAGSPNDFRPTVNLTDVGGVATDIAFVRTDAGLRLAALVPQTKSAVLVEPNAGSTVKVELPAPYAALSSITSAVPSAEGDVVLLYSGSNASVAFWSLGHVVGQPYRSLEVVSLPGSAVSGVLDVPAPHATLKVLQAGSSFFVLDLVARTASPLVAYGVPSIHIAPDGNRLWAFGARTSDLAVVSFDTLAPKSLPLDHAITSVFDLEREGGRSLVALDAEGNYTATVIDANAPDTLLSHTYSSLLLEGLP